MNDNEYHGRLPSSNAFKFARLRRVHKGIVSWLSVKFACEFSQEEAGRFMFHGWELFSLSHKPVNYGAEPS